MNGINHKQAIDSIHLRLDGMLKADQAVFLDEHLEACESCRTYAQKLGTLPAYLNTQFKERWDTETNIPSHIAQRVNAQARKIPLAQRFSSGVKLLGAVAILALFGLAMNFVISRWQSTSAVANENTTATPSSLGGNTTTGLLAFTSDKDGNSEIYVMNPDGTGLTNLTNDPAHDATPFWSPDGRKIAFTSDRDGTNQIYSMDADGSNITRITHGDGSYGLDVNGFSPWSPDGTRLIVYKAAGEDGSRIYTLDVTEKNTTELTNAAGRYLRTSWSPDGTHIAFTADTGRIPQDLFIVGSDGSGLVRVTENLRLGEYFMFEYGWSQDGSALFFATHHNQQSYQDAAYISTVYQANVDGSIEVAARSTNRPILEWSQDMRVRLEWGESLLKWVVADGSESTLKLCENNGETMGTTAKGSHAGNWMVGSNCSANGWILYWTNSDGTIVEPLLESVIPVDDDILFDTAWSFDDQHIAVVTFNSKSVDLSGTLYVLNVAKARQDPFTQPLKISNGSHPSWQSISNQEVVEEEPKPEPTLAAVSQDLPPIGTNISNGEWIAFIGGKTIPDPVNSTAMTTEQDVFLIHPDGSGLLNITNSPNFYFWPQWSPNGNNLLFLRSNNNVDILRKTEPAGFEVLVSTQMSFDVPFEYSWSPNNERIAFVDHRAGNYDIYTVYADGRNDPELAQLTNDPAQDIGFAWSPDGSQIAFQRLNDDQLSVYVMNEDGSNQHEVARGTGKVTLYWSHDGTAIYTSGTKGNWIECEGCNHEPGIYRIGLDGSSVEQIYYEPESNQVGFYLYDTPQNMLYFMRIEPQPFLELWGTWFRADGSSVQPLDQFDSHQTCNTTDGNILSEDISPNQRFSIITNYCAGGFNLYLADREASEPKLLHLIQLPLDTQGQGGDFAYLPITWSPDGRWIVYDNGVGSMLLLDIEKVMQDPDTQPISIIQPILFGGQSGQLFQSSESIFVIDLVWQPNP